MSKQNLDSLILLAESDLRAAMNKITLFLLLFCGSATAQQFKPMQLDTSAATCERLDFPCKTAPLDFHAYYANWQISLLEINLCLSGFLFRNNRCESTIIIMGASFKVECVKTLDDLPEQVFTCSYNLPRPTSIWDGPVPFRKETSQ